MTEPAQPCRGNTSRGFSATSWWIVTAISRWHRYHPPRAPAPPTITMPTSSIARPVNHGFVFVKRGHGRRCEQIVTGKPLGHWFLFIRSTRSGPESPGRPLGAAETCSRCGSDFGRRSEPSGEHFDRNVREAIQSVLFVRKRSQQASVAAAR